MYGNNDNGDSVRRQMFITIIMLTSITIIIYITTTSLPLPVLAENPIRTRIRGIKLSNPLRVSP
jgi:hypothetical protein